jgi:N-acetyl-anhydromuramyl-L-alanine amidase AmpD
MVPKHLVAARRLLVGRLVTVRLAARLALLVVSAFPALGCAAAEEGEDAAMAEALSGGRDLDSFVANATQDGDISGIKFVPTADTAFEAGRPGAINFVVIHDIEGAARSAVNTFRRPGTDASSHYVVDKNGLAVQMVRDRDIANHAFHSVLNAYAIGIEHAGFAAEDGYTRAEYEASAKIVANIVTRYRIPIDRQHIVGHHQVPKADETVDACPENAKNCGGRGGHVDPGPHWDWTLYMSLIEEHARALGYLDTTEAEQAYRKLTPITPMEKLALNKRMFGGYWATQCTADPDVQRTYRTMSKPGEAPRAETRYLQRRVGECGTPTSGVYPLVFRGFPTVNPSRPDLDLTGLEIEQCKSGKKRVYRYSGETVRCSIPDDDCREAVLSLESETDGC